MTAPEPIGPWADGLPEPERVARWRALAALALIYAGGSHPLMRACLAAERDPSTAAAAWRALESLPALTKRRLLSTYAGLSALAAR